MGGGGGPLLFIVYLAKRWASILQSKTLGGGGGGGVDCGDGRCDCVGWLQSGWGMGGDWAREWIGDGLWSVWVGWMVNLRVYEGVSWREGA